MLLQYLFHTSYKNTNNKPQFYFYDDEKNAVEIIRCVSWLEELLLNHGYKGIQAVYFENKDWTKNKKSNCFFSSEQSISSISSRYLELIQNEFYSAKFIGIQSNDIATSFNSIKSTENILSTQKPYLYCFLTRYSYLEKSELLLQSELERTKTDLQNQKTYLEFFKNNDEALKINEFYKNEYEILPLWYKKIGHLLKVLMGKRSFKSLFDNNVKKYNN